MNRVHLKQNAKETVRRNYVPWLLVGIVAVILSYANSQSQVSSDFEPTSYFDIRVRWLNILQLILTVPLTRVAIDLTDGVYKNATDSLFRNAQWLRDTGAMLLVGIYTFFWTLLFIIPGVVKGYAYSMVPYILAEDPDIGISDAIRMSQDMTYGFKMELFILDLSFILWNIASAFTFGLVGLYAIPYQNATWTQYYVYLSERNE